MLLILFSLPTAGLADVAGLCFTPDQASAAQTGSMDHSMHDMGAMGAMAERDGWQSTSDTNELPCCETCIALCASSASPTAPSFAASLVVTAGLAMGVHIVTERTPTAPYSGVLFRPPIAFC
jgi:hypothetical protein